MNTLTIDLWLYGPLARYAKEGDLRSHGHLLPELPMGSTMRDLLQMLGLPPEEKGITFINWVLSDMPGLAADLETELNDGDRVAIFHTQSMWPFQYRHDAALSPALKEAMRSRGDSYHHSYE